MNRIINRVLRRASEKPPRIKSCDFFLPIGMSTYQNANFPPARFGQYRTETFKVDAQDPGAQRLGGAFFRKMPWFGDIGLQS